MLMLIIFIVLFRANANVHTLSYASVSTNGLELVLCKYCSVSMRIKHFIALTSTAASVDMLSLMGYCCITRALSSTDASFSSVQLTPFVDLHHSSEYQPYSIQA